MIDCGTMSSGPGLLQGFDIKTEFWSLGFPMEGTFPYKQSDASNGMLGPLEFELHNLLQCNHGSQKLNITFCQNRK